ncbi:hypothetical protein FRC01_004252 [Tulasnella sp. 417]|nr:hypothetical protein FRC01_004252 [Tulasnella sp. 417]
MQYGNECWCGYINQLNNPTTLTDASCSMACSGDSTLKCGNGYVNSLYGRTSGSSALPAPSGWTQLGCYVDQSSRTLSLASTTDSAAMTVQKCIAFCPATAKYIGVESEKECYCGATLNVNQKVAATDCLSSCVGDPSEICGGSWRLTLFERNGATSSASSSASSTSSTTSTTTSSSATATSSSGPAPAGWTNLGCYLDQTPRTLSGISRGGWTGMTPALCATYCAGYTYFGTEYANECYCGNSLTTNMPKPSTDCNSNCDGDASLKCGGSWRLTVYQRTTGSSSSSSVASTSVSSTTTSSASATPTAWSNQGCYADQTARTLNGASKTDNLMTPAMCQSFCGASGYIYAGVENKVECYCGNSLTVNSPQPSTDCQAPCGGDATQICGGSLNWRMTLYKYVSSPPLPTYTSVGCFVDSATRVLTSLAPTGTSITYTAQTCGTYCAGLGLPYAGVEKSGQQCFCGDRIVLSNTAGTLVSPSECPGSWRVPIYYNKLFDLGACTTFS